MTWTCSRLVRIAVHTHMVRCLPRGRLDGGDVSEGFGEPVHASMTLPRVIEIFGNSRQCEI